MNYIKQMKKALKINKLLATAKLPVVYEYVIHHSLPNGHCMLRHLTTDNDYYGIELTDSIEHIIEQAHLLNEPYFIPITDTSFDMLSTDFYLDKLTPVTVQSITTDGVVLSDGEYVQINRLFIKE